MDQHLQEVTPEANDSIPITDEVFDDDPDVKESATFYCNEETLDINTKNKFECNDDSNYDDRFALQTSCNGIIHMFGRGSRIRHTIWFILTFTMISLCIAAWIQRYDYLESHPTSTVINYTVVKQLKFPAVTICNFNRFRMSFLKRGDWHRIGYLINLFTTTDNNEIFTGLNGKTGEEWNDYLKNISQKLYSNLTFDIKEFLDVKSNQASVLIKGCWWGEKNQKCGPENFTHIYSDYGSCFVFNSGQRAPVLYQNGAGSRFGLKLILNVEEKEYTNLNPEPDIGIKFRVHSQHEPAEIDAEGIAVPPGYHAYTKLEYRKYKFLKPPWGNCGKAKLKYFRKYCRASCQLECLADAYRQECNCRTPSMPGPAPICTPEHIKKCINKRVDSIQSKNHTTCACPIDCQLKFYNPRVTYAEIPLRHITERKAKSYGVNSLELDYLKYNNITVGEYMRNNYVFLDIFYDDLFYKTFKETESYNENQFISDIGGQLGLFVGGSFLTFWEIFEWSQIKLFLVIRKLIHEYKKGNKRRYNSEDLGAPEDTERLL